MQHAFVAARMVRLIGGSVVLDFINTCNGRRPNTSLGQPEERLNSFGFFFEWAHHASLITPEEYTTWLALTSVQQELLEPALDTVKEFRETMFAVFYTLAHRNALDPQALHPLNAILLSTMTSRFLTVEQGQPCWAWKPCQSVQDIVTVMLGRLADKAQALLTGPDLVHLKCCSSRECDWLFLDSSKNKQRRWCQMSVCGSREKLQRMRETSDSA
ncbi:ABATE domain-containing protein [Pseudomonas alliivorans]|nr:ABATE domain-containing protein [Pseudomonas alliivorans]MEE4745178.1 ABATE domain-containing protein [Pseudomonas alliivorans]MEE4919499.1 ABATE domain-containing protein [Pseudomonas alliivorans]MEE5147723.1 ABATE domain-containing protein [Pseudomonas alliivorans]